MLQEGPHHYSWGEQKAPRRDLAGLSERTRGGGASGLWAQQSVRPVPDLGKKTQRVTTGVLSPGEGCSMVDRVCGVAEDSVE